MVDGAVRIWSRCLVVWYGEIGGYSVHGVHLVIDHGPGRYVAYCDQLELGITIFDLIHERLEQVLSFCCRSFR